MVPACRTAGEGFAIPQLDLTPSDVDGFMPELQGFHEAFSECFTRREPREHFCRSMVGQFSDLERQSIEPIALAVEGGNIRAMQRGIRDAVWDEDQMRWTYHHLVNDDLGAPEGVVMFDESGVAKKGQDSVGVARQYWGTLGQVENCQVGVFAAYASRHGYALLDKRLFWPEVWLSDAYAPRRTTCQVPKELTFHTTPQVAAQMLRTLHDEGILPCKYVVADGLSGNSLEFLAAVDAQVDLVYVVAIPADTRGWLQGPVWEAKPQTYKGEVRTKRQVAANDRDPPSVEEVAKDLHACFWYRRTVSEGTKGPLVYEVTKRQVRRCRDGLPERSVWLVLKRSLGAEPTSWYDLSHAPLSARLPLLVWLSGVRWASEPCVEEANTELGMEHYEIRQYPGWHHHMLTWMLAHFFLWHLTIRLGKKSPSAYGVAVADGAGSGVTPAHVYD